MNPQPPATWSPKQERVALLIAAGRSIKAAAKEVGCGERTVHDWLANPQYETFIFELRHRMLDQAVGSLAEATNAAVSELKELLKSKNENIRLKAADRIVAAVVRLGEHAELGRRIRRLEDAHDGKIEGLEIGEGDDEFDELLKPAEPDEDAIRLARSVREGHRKRRTRRPGRNGLAEGSRDVP